jgi:uncharacterized protein
MIEVGSYNYLQVMHKTERGFILGDEKQEVLLPDQEGFDELNLDDDLFVFVYVDEEENLIATLERPYACAGDFAWLEVLEVTEQGALLDLGINTHLFIPSHEQEYPLEAGNKHVFYIFPDKKTGRLTASSWLEDYISLNFKDLEEGEEVSLLISAESEVCYTAIINNKYMGVLYRNELYEKLEIGETRHGYIRKIKEESKKIDLSLRPLGFDFILDSKDVLLEMLRENEGVIPLGDKSAPEEIHQRLKMSKKAFKQVIGGLYKERLIMISDHEIRLVGV